MSIPGLYMSHAEAIEDAVQPPCCMYGASWAAARAWANYRLACGEEREDVYALATQATMRPWSFPADSAVPALLGGRLRLRPSACTDALSLCHPGTTWDDVRRVCKVRDDWREWLVRHGLGGRLRLLSPQQREYLHAARMQRLYEREADAAYDRGHAKLGDECRGLAEEYRYTRQHVRGFLRREG